MTERPPEPKIPVAVLGATGTVGQRFISLLAGHPWFELVALTGSERSAGRRYGEVVQWLQTTPLPAAVAEMTVDRDRPSRPVHLAFSALTSDVAGPLETALAADGLFVVSNASSHRMVPDVPLVVPEVNPDHLALVRHQRFARGGGAIVTNPNCSTIGLVMALKPLADAFGLRSVSVVTMQAISGAGLPGVPSLAITDNVIPWIGGEEEKLETETLKILGRLEGDRVVPAGFAISAQCNRVPVVDGHLECVSFGLAEPATAEEIAAVLAAFSAEPQARELPSAPHPPIVVAERHDRPQPRLDRDAGHGMALTVGRLRPCPVLGWKLVLLSHNTLRGAAGGALLLGELAVAQGLVGPFGRT